MSGKDALRLVVSERSLDADVDELRIADIAEVRRR